MKIYIMIAMILSGIGRISAQDYALSLQGIKERIAHRDSIMKECKKSAFIDSLVCQVKDYNLLSELQSEEINNYSTENKILRDQLHRFMVLTSNDTIVFSQETKGMDNIPGCLRERAELIRCIGELKGMIEQAENDAKGLEQQLGNSPVAYAAIREKIEPELDKIQKMIHRIKEMNLSSLSEEQQRYFRPELTNRYNSFEKYF